MPRDHISPARRAQTLPRRLSALRRANIRREAPLNDRIAGGPVVVFYDPEVVSALDEAGISASREVGASAVFDRRLNGKTLSFEPGDRAGRVRDTQTGSVWDFAGRAIEGRLSGSRLRRIAADDQFWFAIAAFYTDVEIRARG